MLDKRALEELQRSIKNMERMERTGFGEIRYKNTEDNPIRRIERELEKLNQDFEKYRAEQAADKAAQEHSHKLAEKRQFWLGALAGTIGSTIAGLIVLAVKNWPSIVSFLTNIFQKLPPP